MFGRKNKYIHVAIDGPAGAGKTTVGILVAGKLGITYLSTGKIFRTYAYALRDIDCHNKIDVWNEMKQFKFEFIDGKFFINGLDVTMDIMGDTHSMNASLISSYPFVRKQYRKDLKKIIKSMSLVMDGRDIGTVIVPKSPFKFFLTADIAVRAERRAKELHMEKGTKDYEELIENIKKRDHQDITRKESPLKKAKDAVLIQSDNMTAEEVADFICDRVNKTKETWKWRKLQ